MNRKYSDEYRAQVLTLRRSGMTFRAIGAQLGATEYQIGTLVARLEGRHSASEKKNQVAVELLKHSSSPRQIPAAVLADRDRRINAELTPNMVVLGDPVMPRWKSA